jgi:hypothetical protein
MQVEILLVPNRARTKNVKALKKDGRRWGGGGGLMWVGKLRGGVGGG